MLKSASFRTSLVCLVLALGTLLAYGPARHFDFVNFDDQDYVVNNVNVNHGLSWQAVKWSFKAGYSSNWHPLTWMSHALDCQVFGRNFGAMHLENVLIHAANGLLVFLLLQYLTGRTWRSALVAALFAWHPLRVESVAWISERKDVLSLFFFLLAVWAYAYYARNAAARPRGARLFYGAALALFALGLMAKPMIVTLPFVLLLLDVWPLGRISPSLKNLGAMAVEKIPFFALAVLSCALTIYAQHRGGAMRSLEAIPLGTRVINAVVSYALYLSKMIWPSHLSAFYSYRGDVSALKAAAALLIIAAPCELGIRMWRRRPSWLVGWLWFFGTLVPVIGLVQVGSQPMADRYSYLPSIGVLIAVVWLLADWAETRPPAQIALGTVGVVAAALCLYLTHAQALYWRDGGTLARRGIEVEPDNLKAHSTYAAYLLYKGRVKETQEECREILRQAPENAYGHLYLGETLFSQGAYAEAAKHFQAALRSDAYLNDARVFLGRCFLELGQPETARQQFVEALSLNPGLPEAHCGLGRALALENRMDEACYEFAAAIRGFSRYEEAHYQLALALTKMGRPADAAAEYAATVRLNPNRVDALNNLAWFLAANANDSLRNGTEAVQLAERACKLTTNREPLFIGTLAAAYAENGEFDKAAAAAQQAHDLAAAQTNDAVAARNLELKEIYQAHRAFHEQ